MIPSQAKSTSFWDFAKLSIHRPEPSFSSTSIYLILQGCTYLLAGLLALFVPNVVPLLLFFDFKAGQASMMRLVGVVLLVVGYFYIQGGRGSTSTAEWIASSAVHDRLLIPFILMPLGILDQDVPLNLCIIFSVLDSVFALTTYLVWRKEYEPNYKAI